MKEAILNYLGELVQDYKSRKFLLVCGFGVFIILDTLEKWYLNPMYITYFAGLIGFFILAEGIADIITRLQDTGGEVADLTVIQNTPTAPPDSPNSNE